MSANQPDPTTASTEPVEEEDDSSSSFYALIGGFLFCAASAVFLLVGDNWQSQIVDRTSGRRSGLAQLIAGFGQVPTVAVLGALAVLFAALTIRSWRRADKED